MMKRKLKGIVVSDKMDKTVVVNVDRMRKHPRYLKYYRVSRRFKVHDEENKCKIGDVVIIEETRPMSKEKRWKIKERIAENKPELDEEKPAPALNA